MSSAAGAPFPLRRETDKAQRKSLLSVDAISLEFFDLLVFGSRLVVRVFVGDAWRRRLRRHADCEESAWRRRLRGHAIPFSSAWPVYTSCWHLEVVNCAPVTGGVW